MVMLTFINEELKTQDFSQVQNYLTTQGINISQFVLNETANLLATKGMLSDEERIALLDSYSELEALYKDLKGFNKDVICLDPEFEYIDFVMGKFQDIHYHYENEHWYFIDGHAGFGFLGLDGRKFIVNIEAGEHITVPEGKWQWVIPPEDKRMKSMRFFNTTATIPQPEELHFT